MNVNQNFRLQTKYKMHGGYYKSKRVHIFLNGHADSHKAFNIHPRCRLGWNAILDCFSRTMKPYFGAIRVLRTVDGRKVIEDFNDLQHEGNYVACGLESFRYIKGGYVLGSKAKSMEYYPTENLSPDERKKYPCLIETMRKGRTLIYVFVNGKRSNPKKIVLIKSDYKVWESTLKHIGIILDIPEGVKGLYTVFGQPLCSQYEIQHGGYYVAIPFNAAFKPMKYLTTQRMNNYYESSPMVNKAAYLCASKSCPTTDGGIKKRRKWKVTKVKDQPDVETTNTHDELKQHVRIVGQSLKKDEDEDEEHREMMEQFETKAQIRRTGYPGGKFFKAIEGIENSDKSNKEEVKVDSIFEKFSDYDDNKDGDFSDDDLNENSTQTDTIFLEATHDKDNGIMINQRKYYIVPEKEILKYTDLDTSEWCRELLGDLQTEIPRKCEEEETKMIKILADKMVGFIVTCSETIANKALYKDSASSMVEVEEKTSSDTPHSNSEVKEHMNSDKTSDSSIGSKEKCLRLSIPIGRVSYSTRQIISVSDSADVIHDSSLEIFDKQFKPLTPSHTVQGNLIQLLNLSEDDDDDEILKENSTILRNLRKDSIGFNSADLIHSKDSQDNSSLNNLHEKDDMYENSDDEWRKLSILDDMGVMTEEEMQAEEDKDLLSDEQPLEDGEEIYFDESEKKLQYEDVHITDISENENEIIPEETNEDNGNEKPFYNSNKKIEKHNSSCGCSYCENIVYFEAVNNKENIEKQTSSDNTKILNMIVDEGELRLVKLHTTTGEEVLALLLPIESDKQKTIAIPIEIKIIRLDGLDPEVAILNSVFEKRRVTLNTWDNSIERILKNKFQDCNKPLNKSSKVNMGVQYDLPSEAASVDIDVEQVSLIEHFKRSIEDNLNSIIVES